MASTYNFTVRAEDDQGAFADRDFSIVVKNTSVDRYMVVDATDAYTSPDMVTWTKRGGQGGRAVIYGGGQWLIPYGASNSMTYRLSNDGVTFSNHTINFPVTSGAGSTRHDPMWDSGYWWVMVTGNLEGTPQSALLKSADGVNWVIAVSAPTPYISVNFCKPSFHNGHIYYGHATTSPMGYYKFDMSLVGEKYTTNQMIPMSLPTPPSYGTYNGINPPRKINDLWITAITCVNGTAHYYSTDLLMWSLEASPAAALPNMGSGTKLYDQYTYLNGVIVCYASAQGSGGGGTYIFSDDGRNWVRKPNAQLSNVSLSSGQRANVVMSKGVTYFITVTHFLSSPDLGETGMEAPSNPSVSAQFPVASINGFAAIQ